MENNYKKIIFAVEGHSDLSYLNNLIDVSKDISKVIYDSNFEEIITICDAFRMINNKIFELKEELLNTNAELQKAFIYGFLDGIYSVSSNLEDIIKLAKKTESVFKNTTIMQVINVLGSEGVLTHKELAEKLAISPQSLSMRFNRHPEWVDYIVSEENHVKGSSVIYRLNGNGKLVFSKYRKTISHHIYNSESINVHWVRYIKGQKHEADSKIGGYRVWEQRPIIPTKR